MNMNKDMVQLQIQNHNGTWRNVRTCSKDPFYYVNALKKLKEQYTKERIRVVDYQGTIIDMMN